MLSKVKMSGTNCLSSSLLSQKNQGKAVRFSDDSSAGAGVSGDPPDSKDDFISKLPRSHLQRNAPSTSLRTMFFADTSSNAGAPTTTSKPTVPQTSSTSRSRPSSSSGNTASKDDWLGIQDGKTSRSPSNSPPPTRRSRSAMPAAAAVTPQKGSVDQNKSNDNSSGDEEALFKDIGILPPSGKKSSAMPAVTPQNPPVPANTRQQQRSASENPLSQHRSRFRGGSRDSTPPVSLGGVGSQESPKLPPKSTFSGSILDQLGKSPTVSPRSSMDMGKPVPVGSKNSPLPSVATLLGTNPGPPSTFPPQMETIPNFPPKLPNAEAFSSFSLAAPSVVPEPSPPQIAPTTKKKVIKKDGTTGGNVTFGANSSTLQLPSHLINEEELKAMSTSLKTLYTNQLEQLQISYKEQLNFLGDANKRKEELLKDEMKTMQTDYEERLDRLRKEIHQLESKQTLKAQLPTEEMATITALSEQLNSSIVTLQSVLNKSREDAAGESSAAITQDMMRTVLREHYERSQGKLEGMEDKVCGVVKSVDDSVAKRFSLMNDAWRNLVAQVKQNMTDVIEANRQNNNSQQGNLPAVELAKVEEKLGVKLDVLMGSMMERLDKALGSKEDTSGKLITKMEGKIVVNIHSFFSGNCSNIS